MSGGRQRFREAVAWPIARLCWTLRLERLGNHFEDVAWCGKQWFGPKYPPPGSEQITVGNREKAGWHRD